MDSKFSKLLKCSWSLINTSESPSNWLMKFIWDGDDNSYQFAITNSVCVFVELLTSDEVKARCKELNKRLEAPIQTILAHLQKSLQQQQTTLTFPSENERIVSVSNSFYGGIPFSWRFVCKRDFMQSLSKLLLSDPMVLSVARLLFENNKLKELLHQKDNEIKDYKESGCKVSRPHLETKQFISTAFDNDLRCSRDYAISITKNPLEIMSEKNFNDALTLSITDSKSTNVLEMVETLPSKINPKCESSNLSTVSRSPITKGLNKKRRVRPAVRGCVLDVSDRVDESSIVDNEKDNINTNIPGSNVTKKKPKICKPHQRNRRKLFQ